LVNEALTKPKFGDPYDRPYITGLKLERDVILGNLVLNRIDTNPASSTYNTIWVCTDIEGWWEVPAPEVPNIPRGLDDGSYDVRGRWLAREMTLRGTILPPSKSVAPYARQELLSALDIVYKGVWLRVKEEPMRSAYVRMVGKPTITNINARGKIEFSVPLRSGDPIKYGWNGGSTQIDRAFRRDNVVSVTTSAAHGFSVGNSITIFDLGTPFNGTHTIDTVGAEGRTFTYANTASDTTTTVNGYVILSSQYDANNGYTLANLSAAVNNIGGTSSVSVTNSGTTNVAVTISITGPMTAPAYIRNITTGQNIRVVKNLRANTLSANVTTIARTAQTTTLTTNIAHSFIVGDTITVANLGVPTANGTKTVYETTATTVSYLDPGVAIANAVLINNTVNVCAPSHGFLAPNSVYVYGLGTPFDGTYSVSAASTNYFEYTKTYSNVSTVYEGYAIIQYASTSDLATANLTYSDSLEIDTYNTTVL
ncbi:MAG: hypothetical protein EBU08_19365, partial [Micrococcales bacterium]|nr:hypothetical protein [Micrococcales bacterium]